MATRRSGTDGGIGLPTRVVDDLLAEEHRRLALSILDDRNEPVVVESLAKAVVAARDGCSPGDVTTADQRAMSEELFTEHIPKLTATGVVDYNSMVGTVELVRDDVLPDGN